MEYNTDFLNFTEIFDPSETKDLFSLAGEYPFDDFIADHRRFEERSIDYAYVSSKIEGNQYSKKGASLLLQYGFTEAGKTFQDAAMLVNIRDAFVNVTLNPDENIGNVLSKHYVRSIHSQVADKLIRPSARGQVRLRPVTISGSEYIPLATPYALEDELEKILTIAKSISNPFAQAVYVHCNLAYLQYFEDGNKRVSRLMQTAVLSAHKITPIFLQESSVQAYLLAVLSYYETGDYAQYKKLFIQEYEHTIRQLQGRTPEQLMAEEQALAKIKSRRP